MTNIKVNIVMNCFNGEEYLKEAIDSLIAQTYEDWELIFWDNCSTDKSASIVKNYNDKRIMYFQASEHTSQYEARKQAVLKCNREFIAFLDVDDLWVAIKLENQLQLFNDDSVGFVSSNYWIINQKNNKKRKVFKSMPKGHVLDKLLVQNFIGMSSLMVRKKSYFNLEYGFNPKYEIVGDYDLVLRLALKNKFSSTEEPLSYYRWHGKNLSHQIEKNAEELKQMVEEMKSIPLFFNNKNFSYFEDFSKYLASLGYKLNSDFYKALYEANKIKDIFLKIRILIILLLPIKIIKIIKS